MRSQYEVNVKLMVSQFEVNETSKRTYDYKNAYVNNHHDSKLRALLEYITKLGC